MTRRDRAAEHLRDAFEANAADILAYLERRIEPRSLAADVLGDAMETAWKRVSDLPVEPSEARMWLFVVARNTLLNHRRALGRHREAVERLRGVIVSDMATASSETDRAEMQATVRAAMAVLESADAELIRLVNWDGFSLVEVAQIEGIAPSTVRSRYARALRQLEVALTTDTAGPEPARSAPAGKGKEGEPR